VPGEFGVSGGCCEGDGFQDVRQHVVTALRCLAGALEFQSDDWGRFANQQYWTEDTTWAAEVVLPGTVADERLGFSPGVAVAAVAEVDCVLPGSSVGPVVVVEGCFNLCDESVGEHDRAAWAAVPVDTQAAVFAEFFDCEEEFVQIAAPLVAAGPDIFAEVGKDVLALGCADADAGADAAWVPGLGLFTIPGVIAEVGNDVTAAGCKEADAGADAAGGPGFGLLTIPGVIAEVGNDITAACGEDADVDAGADAAWVTGLGLFTIPGVIAEVGNDVTAAGCEEADACADAAWGPRFGLFTIPGVIAEVGNDVVAAGSRASLSLVSALGPARCDPDSWEDCWHVQAVPQGLFVQLSVVIEAPLFGMSLSKAKVGIFFRGYGEVHIEVEDGGSQAFVTLTQAHQARAAQRALDRLHLKVGQMCLRVRFCGLVGWPGTNRVHDSSSSGGASLGSAACTPNLAERFSKMRRGLAVSATASVDPSVLECGEEPSGLSYSATVDVVEPLDLAVLQPPTRPGNGKGKSQRDLVISLAASSTAPGRPEEPEESEDLLGGEAVFDDDFLRIIEELRVSVCELSGMSKKARRRHVAALKPVLERVEACASALPPAAAATFAEIQLALL
jgi:hypothetical protein